LRDRPIIVLLAAAVAAGLAIGFAGSTLAYRYKLIHLPGANLVDRMNQSLNLDPSQREQIVEVMEDTRAKVGHLRREFQRQRRQVLLNAYIQIRSLLTPEQQQRFDRDFVPPRFRSEAEQLEQQAGGGEQTAPPAPPPPASPASPQP